ncbi:MAG: Agmatinase [uncultured Thermoleophilia bacterium]|uniref:Agmatinase n=1 Tax=uncultured Thermoleophilia bacterium TaxID=1497501 RepID=A0A6J4UNW3_9ACTN|nr:MAG: Agmatinase [uncultured Thermoleophilia bacterium]
MRPFRPAEPSYAGVGVTFCRTELVLEPADLRGADVAIVGAPFDDGTSFRPGARFGPRAIRAAEDVAGPSTRPHMELGVDPFAELRVVDHGDIEATPADLATSHRRLRATLTDVLEADAIPVVLGGDHSLSTPTMQALADRLGPDGYAVLHFDTHADTGATTFGVANTHGTPFHRGVTEGFLRGDHVVQVGLRGTWPTPPEFAWMRDQGFRWHTMDEIEDRGLPSVVAEAVASVTGAAPRVYLTVDIDVLDPAFAPGTGTPEPGGLTTRELLRAVRTVAASVDLCAMDLVEVSPPYDPAGVTALAAQRLVLETLSGLALRRSGRSARPERP